MNDKSFSLKGLGVALITPFSEDNSVDYHALETLIEYLISGGVDYLVVLGTTAETPTLSVDERNQISDFVAEKVSGRIPLVLGMGGNNTQALCGELSRFKDSRYSAILSVAPFYNKPTQEGLYQHFSKIAETSHFPTVLYNIPSRTGVNINVETILRLANEHKGKIVGVKEASGDIESIKKLLELKPAEFEIVSGDDALTQELMSLGACGVISVAGNAIPGRMSRLVRLCLENKWEEAKEEDENLKEFFRLLFADGNPSGIKCALSLLGMTSNKLRLPLIPVSTHIKEQLAFQVESLSVGHD